MELRAGSPCGLPQDGEFVGQLVDEQELEDPVGVNQAVTPGLDQPSPNSPGMPRWKTTVSGTLAG